MTHSCPTLRSSDLGEARLLSRGAGPHRPAHRFGQTCGTEKPRLHRWCGRLCGDMQAASRAPLNGDAENPEPTSVERAPDDSPDGSREGSTVDSTGDSGDQNVALARTPPTRRPPFLLTFWLICLVGLGLRTAERPFRKGGG